MGLCSEDGDCSQRWLRSERRRSSTSSSFAGSWHRTTTVSAGRCSVVLPTFVFGMWLLTVSSSRAAVFISAAATAMAVGSAYETFAVQDPGLTGRPWFPSINLIGLTADAVASAGFVSMFASFPTGVPERRWQRVAVGLLWVPVLVAPLSLLTNPHVLVPLFVDLNDAIPNALMDALARLGGPCGVLGRLPVALCMVRHRRAPEPCTVRG